MAKISDLTAITTIADNHVLVINDGTPTTKKITVANLKTGLGLPSRYLYANLNQTGTNAPTMIIVKNTLGYVPTFTYYGAGDYTMDFQEAISAATAILTSAENRAPYITSIRISGGGLKIDTYTHSGSYVNGVLVNASIKLEIYE